VKKNVLINIKGVHRAGDDNDVVEMFTTGQYYKKEGAYYISYEESELTGFEGSKTTLKIENENVVTLKRTGTANTELIIESGVRHQRHYDVGVGEMMIGVMGSKIASTLGDDGGNLMFRYAVDIDSLLASENEMYLHVVPSDK